MARALFEFELTQPPEMAQPYPPRPEVLCSRLAAFGLVENSVQASRSGRAGWECRPQLVLVDPRPEAESTSIYTDIRAADLLGVPRLRFKLNALDDETTPRATAIIVSATRSVARSYGVEVPFNLVAALEALDRTDIETECVSLIVDSEWDDDRRHNIFVTISPGCVRWPVRPTPAN